MKNKVCLIDDDNFESLTPIIMRLEEKFEVELINPTGNINDTVSLVIESQFDAILIDYRLNDYIPEVHYDGIDVFNKINFMLCDMPMFLLTAKRDHAQKSMKINLENIFDKEYFKNNKKELLDLLDHNIQVWHQAVKEKEKKILKYISKKNKTAQIDNEIMEIDKYLSTMCTPDYTLPEYLDKTKYLEDLKEAISISENILEKLKEI